MKNTHQERITSFLNLLLGIDSGAMVYLLVTHYNRGGAKLPVNLPFDIPLPQNELSFGWQVAFLGACAAAILVIHAFSLWMHQSPRFQRIVRRIAVGLLAATLTAVGTAGYKIVKEPGLLRGGERAQKG